MKKLILAVALGGMTALPTTAMSQATIIGAKFDSKQECQRALNERLQEGREARRTFGGNTGDFSKDAFGIRCEKTDDGKFTVVSPQPDKFD